MVASTVAGSVLVEHSALLADARAALSVGAAVTCSSMILPDGTFAIENCAPETACRLSIRGDLVEPFECDITTAPAGMRLQLPAAALKTAIPLRVRIRIDEFVAGWFPADPGWTLEAHPSSAKDLVLTLPPRAGEVVTDWVMHSLNPSSVVCQLHIPARFPVTLAEAPFEFSPVARCLQAPPIQLTKDALIVGSVVDWYDNPLSGSEVHPLDDRDTRSSRRFAAVDCNRFLLPGKDLGGTQIVADFGPFHSAPATWHGDPIILKVDTRGCIRVQLLDESGSPVPVYGCGTAVSGMRSRSPRRDSLVRDHGAGIATLRRTDLAAGSRLYFWGPGFADFRILLDRELRGAEQPLVVRLAAQPTADLTVIVDTPLAGNVNVQEIDARGKLVAGGWSYFTAPEDQPQEKWVLTALPLGRYRCTLRSTSRILAFGDADLMVDGATIRLVPGPR
jgi:hypothetical protein